MAVDKQLRKILTAFHTFAKLKTTVRTNASTLANQLHTSAYCDLLMLNKSTKKRIKENARLLYTNRPETLNSQEPW